MKTLCLIMIIVCIILALICIYFLIAKGYNLAILLSLITFMVNGFTMTLNYRNA
jgi:hypothetical protein